ncbi:ORF6N domain-containing protein [Segetibacter sp.]|uniref:ORF6N domain-containing protein n=1 Tax=Segetibacter sp. TaxID=2231182 RepID=UPI0034227165
MRQNIFAIRGQKVIPEFDFARLYKVETSTLHQAIKRNPASFPTISDLHLE